MCVPAEPLVLLAEYILERRAFALSALYPPPGNHDSLGYVVSICIAVERIVERVVMLHTRLCVQTRTIFLAKIRALCMSLYVALMRWRYRHGLWSPDLHPVAHIVYDTCAYRHIPNKSVYPDIRASSRYPLSVICSLLFDHCASRPCIQSRPAQDADIRCYET